MDQRFFFVAVVACRYWVTDKSETIMWYVTASSKQIFNSIIYHQKERKNPEKLSKKKKKIIDHEFVNVLYEFRRHWYRALNKQLQVCTSSSADGTASTLPIDDLVLMSKHSTAPSSPPQATNPWSLLIQHYRSFKISEWRIVSKMKKSTPFNSI